MNNSLIFFSTRSSSIVNSITLNRIWIHQGAVVTYLCLSLWFLSLSRPQFTFFTPLCLAISLAWACTWKDLISHIQIMLVLIYTTHCILINPQLGTKLHVYKMYILNLLFTNFFKKWWKNLKLKFTINIIFFSILFYILAYFFKLD